MFKTKIENVKPLCIARLLENNDTIFKVNSAQQQQKNQIVV